MTELKEMYDALTKDQKKRCKYPPISSEDADKIRWLYVCYKKPLKTFRVKYMTGFVHNMVEVEADDELGARLQIDGDVYEVTEVK
jgi:hypothetical protein